MAKFRIKKSSDTPKRRASTLNAELPAGVHANERKRFDDIVRRIHDHTETPVDEADAQLREFAEIRREAINADAFSIDDYEQVGTDYLNLFISHKLAAYEGYRSVTGRAVSSDDEADELGLVPIFHPDLFRQYFANSVPRAADSESNAASTKHERELLHRSAISMEDSEGNFYGALQGTSDLKGSPANWRTDARLRANGARKSNHPVPRHAFTLDGQFRGAARMLSAVLKVSRRDLAALMHRCYEARFELYEVNPLRDDKAAEIAMLVNEHVVPRHIERVREIRAEQSGWRRAVWWCVRLAKPEFIELIRSDDLVEQIRDYDGPLPKTDN